MSSPKLPEIIYLNGLRFVQPSEAQPLEVDQESLKGRCLMSQNDLPEVVYLNGVRFARVSEPQPGEEGQDALIRALTSGEPIRICGVRGDFKLMPIEPRPLRISGRDTPDSQDL